MNYIWDILIRAQDQGIKKENIKFKNAEVCSPYMETSFAYLNVSNLPENMEIEVNPNYRFYEIFKDLFNINIVEDKEIREATLDIILHYLGEIDLKSGVCKEEFHKMFLYRDILNEIYGEELAKNIKEFNKKELDVFLNGLLTLTKTGSSILLLNKIIKIVFNKSIVYMNKGSNKALYIYLGVKKTKENIKKINAIIDTFLPINISSKLFWNMHFGIIGIDNTMMIDEIVIVD